MKSCRDLALFAVYLDILRTDILVHQLLRHTFEALRDEFVETLFGVVFIDYYFSHIISVISLHRNSAPLTAIFFRFFSGAKFFCRFFVQLVCFKFAHLVDLIKSEAYIFILHRDIEQIVYTASMPTLPFT